MKAFFLPLLFFVSLYGTSIDTIIDTAYKNNSTIKKLELQIQSSDYDIKNSDLYKNPVLTFGLNDINIDEPTKRDIEAMQATYISISQEITDGDKIEQKTNIARINKEILTLILKEQKNQIAKGIYDLAFNIDELNKKIKLNKQKIKNIQKIKNYHSNHIEHKKAFQVSLQNDLMIDTLNIQIESDTQMIEQLYARLAELVNSDIKTIDTPSILKYKDNIDSHTLLQIEELNIKKAYAKKDLAKENEISDYTLSGGYYQRDGFDDYINIAIKFPLNIYSKESNDLHKAYKELDISKSKFDEVKNRLLKLQKIELSKTKFAKNSISYTNQILQHLEKEKELVTNQNNRDSLIELLDIENKIIDNHIKLLEFKKQLGLSSVELAYFTSALKGE
jgi:outer membrane protein TolC